MSTYLPIQTGCTFYPYGSGRYVLKTPDQRQFLVTHTTKELLEALESNISLEAICETLSDGTDTMSAAELRKLIEERYSGLGLFSVPASVSLAPRRNVQRMGAGFFLPCWDSFSADSVNAISARLLPLYQRFVVISILILNVFCHILLYKRGTAAYSLQLAHGSQLVVLTLSLFSVVAHEIGHATALLHFGAKPGKIGFGLYVLMPTFFADVSQVWCLPRRGRYVVDLGGVYFQQAVFIAFAAGALWSSSRELMAVCVAIDTMTFLALNPLFRFDGYWLLADWLGMPKLHNDALLLLKQWADSLFGRQRSSSIRMPELEGAQAAVFFVYTALCSVFLAIAVLLSFRYLHSSVIFVFHNLPLQLSRIAFSIRTHDWLTATDQMIVLLIACMFLITAIFGIYAYSHQLVSALKNKISKVQSTRIKELL